MLRFFGWQGCLVLEKVVPTMGVADRIKEVEFEMSRTQKNKATEGHLGLLKAKLSKLRAQLAEGPKVAGGVR